MAANVLHFGWDDCYRVLVLRRAGYTVVEVKTLEALDLGVQRDHSIDAVIFSDHGRQSTELAASVVRRRSTAPLILFGAPHATWMSKSLTRFILRSCLLRSGSRKRRI